MFIATHWASVCLKLFNPKQLLSFILCDDNIFPFCQNSCTLKYIRSSSYGYTPFELVVEDFPNRNITLSYSDGSYTTKGPLSVGRRKRQSPLTTTTVPTTTALFRRSIAPLSKLPLQFTVYGSIYIYIFYFSSIDSNVNIYYQILSMTQRPSPLPSDFQWTLLPLHALMVITFPFSWHQLQLMEQIFRRLSTRQSTSKSDPEHKTPRKEMLFLKHSVILQQICEHHMCVMCIDIRFSCYFCNVTYFL